MSAINILTEGMVLIGDMEEIHLLHAVSTGISQGWVLSCSPSIPTLSVISLHCFSYHSYADDTQLILSLPTSEAHVSAWISSWMVAHQLKPNHRSQITPYLTACNPAVVFGQPTILFGLLRVASSRPTIICSQTPRTHPECSYMTCFQTL